MPTSFRIFHQVFVCVISQYLNDLVQEIQLRPNNLNSHISATDLSFAGDKLLIQQKVCLSIEF